MTEEIRKLKEENERIIAQKAEVERKLAALEAIKNKERLDKAINDATRNAVKFIDEKRADAMAITSNQVAGNLGCSVEEANHELKKLVSLGYIRAIATVDWQRTPVRDEIGYRITTEGRIFAKSIS